ncbi:MAG TPA: mandelate racemase/muconate lactonizing enzyme family protein [Blastocatellia bacterium]|nr:mandelate racemase/muconate lactonizing enzyme family protein [Blastocatellia bacterium]
MKITALKTFVIGSGWRNLILLRLETDEPGLYGIGEATVQWGDEGMLGYLVSLEKRYLIGQDPRDIEALWERVYRNEYWRRDFFVCSALGGVEMACWDILGKSLGVPVWRLLGGKCRDQIRAYANGWYQVERTPEAIAARAREVVGRGYNALKIDPFGAGSYEMTEGEKQRSVEIIRAVREAIGPETDLFIEMHGRFAAHTAIDMCHRLAPFKPGWFEEPVPPENSQALLEVRRAVAPLGIPVAAGERSFTRYLYLDLFRDRAVDIIQPDVCHAGGIAETRKIAAMAEAHYIPVAPHNACSPVGTMASVHVAVCTPNFKIQETFDDMVEQWVRDAIIGRPEVKGGYFSLPEKPGLGVDLNEAVIAEHPPMEGFMDFWKTGWEKRDTYR